MVPASECAEGMQGPHICTSPDQLAKRQSAANSEVDQNRPTSRHRVACPLDTKNKVVYRKIVRLSPTPPPQIKTRKSTKQFCVPTGPYKFPIKPFGNATLWNFKA